MSKFVLLFVAIFVLVGVCYAGDNESSRSRRDVAEDAKKALDQAGEAVKGFFTEDTWNKVVEGAKTFGDNVKKVADDIVQKVSEKTEEKPAV